MNEELESAFTISEGLSEWATNFIINSSDSDIIASVDLVLHSVEVTAATRMMRTAWTPELVQDMSAYQTIDAAAELTEIFEDVFYKERERTRIKKQRYKDRRIYIKMIEEWAGVEVDKKLPLAKNGKR